MLATAEALKQHNKGIQLHYVGSSRAREQQFFSGLNIKQHYISSGKYRRYPGSSILSRLFDVKTLILNVIDAAKFVVGLYQSFRLLTKLRPDAVLVRGGHIGLPIGLVASWKNISLIIHESDSVISLTNRLLAPRATQIATGLPKQYYPSWKDYRLTHTGIPVRSQVCNANPSAQSKNPLPKLLIVGGSSGASVINDIVIKNLATLCQRYNVVHVAGKRNWQLVAEASQLSGHDTNNYHLYDFLSAAKLGGAISAATVVVSRSGMTAVAEIAAHGKALITIPIAISTHQRQNAELLSKAGAAVMIEESELNEQIMPAVDKLMSSKTRRKQLGTKLQGLFEPQAAEKLANLITQSL